MIDTHAHLDACADPPEALVERAREAGVTRFVTVGTTLEGCRNALALAETHEGVYAALGIHPHEAGGDEAAHVEELEALLAHPKAVAVGETGLDHYRDYAPHDAQLRLFERLLGLAEAHGKPAVIHTRAADAETAAVLAGFPGEVVLHCFSSPALLPLALERRWYVSFAGNVTYPKAPDLREAAAQVPADRILAETDCPYLAPQPRRGRPSEPADVVHTLAALAEARGEEPGRARAAHRRERGRRLPAVVTVRPKKKLGQHFLVDENILGVIGRLAELAPGDRVLEIGPGLGVLTAYLADRVAHVDAVELDRSLEAPLRERLAPRTNVDLHFGDALALDLGALARAKARLEPAVQRRHARDRREPRRAADRRALVRDGAAGGRRPAVRLALDQGLRRRLGARPARGRANRASTRSRARSSGRGPTSTPRSSRSGASAFPTGTGR